MYTYATYNVYDFGSTVCTCSNTCKYTQIVIGLRFSMECLQRKMKCIASDLYLWFVNWNSENNPVISWSMGGKLFALYFNEVTLFQK